MTNVKQVIIARKDLKLKKGELASTIASASIKFLLENNESDRNDELLVRLSQQEIQWLNDSSPRIVLGVDSHDALSDLMFKAELLGVNVYPVVDDVASKQKEERVLSCIALGPDEENLINQITGHLKPI